MDFRYSKYTYSVPSSWYDGVYHDRAGEPSSCRSFCILHEDDSKQEPGSAANPATARAANMSAARVENATEQNAKPSQVWLIVHGFRGYPGEMVRPAQDLFDAGFDVFVPRLPGHGTSAKDFLKSEAADWTGLVRNAIADLKTKYQIVNVLGHSMGSAIAAVTASNDPQIGKIVYMAPAFNDDFLPAKTMNELKFLSLFVKQVRTPWQPDSRFHLHYENAPCDDEYLGREYWSHFQLKQLLSLQKIMKSAQEALSRQTHESLMICAMEDAQFSIPSAAIYKILYKDKAKITEIPGATHYIQYDMNAEAEEKAMKAITDYALDKTGRKQ